MHLRTLSAVAATLAMITGTASAQSRSIEHVTGDVYRFQDETHFSMFTVTEDGVVVVDPINSNAVGWLQRNLKDITEQKVTHLIYSHSHADHASGGIYYRAGTVIAHDNAPKAIDGVKPTIRFSDAMTLSVGKKTFELTFLGIGHGNDTIAVVVRPENVAFIVDVASPKRLPFRDFPLSDIDGRIAQIEKLRSLDFEIFAPGHGLLGVKTDLDDNLAYLTTLRAEVLKGLRAGKSIDELKASIKMEAYSDWAGFQSLELNIEGMARYLIEEDKVN